MPDNLAPYVRKQLLEAHTQLTDRALGTRGLDYRIMERVNDLGGELRDTTDDTPSEVYQALSDRLVGLANEVQAATDAPPRQ